MTTIHERIDVPVPLEATFDRIADFANAEDWDPGVVRARALDAGPPAVGSRYDLVVRMGGSTAPMTYRITELERPSRVVLVGTGPDVDAVDEIRFAASGDGTGTTIDYTADIRLGGWKRLIQPFLGGTFERIGRDAAAGMTAYLAHPSSDHA